MVFAASAMPDRDWWSALWPDPEAILIDIDLQPGMTVLDLCCGDGYFTVPLAKLAQGRVYALDIDAQLIDQAKTEAARQGVTVLTWFIADAQQVDALLPEPVDAVLIANTFHGVPDQPGLARAVARVLKPGGMFAIINWHPKLREETTVLGQPRGPKTELRMAPERLQAAVEPAGFHLRRVAELPPYHYASLFERL